MFEGVYTTPGWTASFGSERKILIFCTSNKFDFRVVVPQISSLTPIRPKILVSLVIGESFHRNFWRDLGWSDRTFWSDPWFGPDRDFVFSPMAGLISKPPPSHFR